MKNVYDSFEYREFNNQMDENIGDIIFDQQDDEDCQDEESDEYREFFELMNFFFDMATVDVEQVNDYVEQVNDHVKQVNDESIESFTINYQTVTELKVKFNELIVKYFVRNSNK